MDNREIALQLTLKVLSKDVLAINSSISDDCLDENGVPMLEYILKYNSLIGKQAVNIYNTILQELAEPPTRL